MKKCKSLLIAMLCSMSLAFPAAAWDASVVQQVQQRLNEEGYDCGTPDGVAGSKTAEAITAFQMAQNLPADGEISEELLAALGVGAEVEAEDPYTEEAYEEESYDWQYVAEASDLYYTEGDDLILLEYEGMQIILKGDQSEAEFFGNGVELAVEVVNDSELYFDIYYGMNVPAQEDSYFNITNYLFDINSEEGTGIYEYSMRSGRIYGLTADTVTAMEDLTTIQLFFGLEYYAGATGEYGYYEAGPVNVHFPGEMDSEEPVYLIGGTEEYTGKRVNLAQTAVFGQELEICVPEEWQYSVVEKDGFAIGEFISAEQIGIMKEYLSGDSDEAYIPKWEGVVTAFTDDKAAVAALDELAMDAGACLVAEGAGVSVYEVNETTFTGNTEFFTFINERKTWDAGAALFIRDAIQESAALILVNEADPVAGEAYASLRLLIEGGENQIQESDLYTVYTDVSELPEMPEDLRTWCGGLPETITELKENVQNMSGYDLGQLASYYEDPVVLNMVEEFEKTGTVEGFGALAEESQEWSGSVIIDDSQFLELEWVPAEEMLRLSEPIDLEQAQTMILIIRCCPCENQLVIWNQKGYGPVNVSRVFTNQTEDATFLYSIAYYEDNTYWLSVELQEMDQYQYWTGYYDETGQLADVGYQKY